MCFILNVKLSGHVNNKMKAMLQTCGITGEGKIEEMIEQFIDHLEGLEKPVVIIDQLDKLNDSSLDLFIDFYNDLDGYCSFVISEFQLLKNVLIEVAKETKQDTKNSLAE